jgi:hypothetical protein
MVQIVVKISSVKIIKKLYLRPAMNLRMCIEYSPQEAGA